MAKTREIKKRIRSIESTRKITRTMELVATSKLKRAQDQVLRSRPYSTKLREILAMLASTQEGGFDHPLLRLPASIQNVEILLVASNRGLCGSYNTNVIAEAVRVMEREQSEGRNVRVHVSGKKGMNWFRFRKLPLASTATEPSERPRFEHADRMGEEFIRAFTGVGAPGGEPAVDRVVLVYTRFVSAGVLRAVAETLLPLTPEDLVGTDRAAPAAPTSLPIFEPDRRAILETLLPLYVKARVWEALLNAQASEQSARMVAMKMATDNAGELITSLTRAYNKQRQAQITQELAEIMGGVEALKG